MIDLSGVGYLYIGQYLLICLLAAVFDVPQQLHYIHF